MSSFGDRLKHEREARSITLDEISASTKIATRMLRALEEDHFDQLPGGIFNKGFVRAYARHVGLDEDETVADYLEAAGESLVQPNLGSPPVPQEPPVMHPAARVPWEMLALVLLIIAVGFALWGSRDRDKHAGSEAQTPSAGTRGETPPTPNQQLSNPGSLPASPQSSVRTAMPVVGTFTVAVEAKEDCWVSVTADGRQVLQDTLVAPAVRQFQAQKQIVVKVGNAGAVRVLFNGKSLPSPGDYGEVKTLVFNVRGLQLSAQPAAPQATSVPQPIP